MEKRTFLKRMGQLAAASPFLMHPGATAARSLDATAHEVGPAFPSGTGVHPPKPFVTGSRSGSPAALRGLQGNELWERVRADYELKEGYINLESGYYNIIPRPTLEAFLEKVRMVNREGAYYMRTVQWENKARIAARLAGLLGCGADELILTRNTTESLDMIIGGYPWKAGDEAVYAEQDYGAMQMQFGQVAARFGVVNRVVSLPLHPASDAEIVNLYESAITPRTRLLMVCHMVNITGQILPIRKICEMAHSHGVEVLVDGAHCVGHFPVDIPALDCDYYGSSLHKWLAAPLGAGMLYVRKEHIPRIWPLLAEHHREPTDIGRLNHTGTHPVHTDLAIDAALDYLEALGLERKSDRLRHLQRSWTEPLRGVKGVRINTPEEPRRSCAIANVGVDHLTPAGLADVLFDEFGIYTVAIDGAGVRGCRITPNVFNTEAEMEHLVEAITTLAARG
ncbi:aminotransferase class V-fold PLP-dependent enzyme [Robiginitalea sp. SC105]|uniref:aminotransferase class V-fold PLP-dependent enzyme n=1 Tax=Robiginitalea sp. SC105 TaxID=2762332 RepID=UPI00163A1A35|nr:aminotransferase class V-fold PLP-dependent enzyme [Robiginitalea sp. SC105]MBC2840152.1 aminotransferase class V-fold PLP-dependent enzyme [Robiginitalea sp. SC105]